jgi:hypothetical protein
MKNEIRRSGALSAVIAAASLAASPANADWTEHFSGAAPQYNWTIFDNQLNSPPDTSNVSYAANNLQIVGQPSLDPDLFVAGVVGLGDPQHRFGDVTVRSTVFATSGFNFTPAPARGNNHNFVIARLNLNAESNTTSGYVLALDYQTGDVDLIRSDESQIVELNASGEVSGFDPSRSYMLELQAEGSNLTGRVFDAGVPVVTVSASDTTYTSGWSGVGAIINTDTGLGDARTFIAAGFDDVSSTAISTPIIYDLTGDGQVTLADLARFSVNFGKPDDAVFSEGDFDGNQRVTLNDLVLLKSQLVAPSAAVVPEPSTWALGLIGIAVLVYLRRV